MFDVYLAGPITGHSYAGATEWRASFGDQLKDLGMNPISPMRGKDYLLNEKKVADAYEQYPMSSEAGIFGRDVYDVRNCNAVVVNFLDCGDRVSIGSICEIAMAWAYGKYVLLVMTPDNVHNHTFLRRMSSLIVDDLDVALDVMARLGGAYV